MPPRIELTGGYSILNLAKLRERANRSDDPRKILYDAMMANATYEGYYAAVGAQSVKIPTPRSNAGGTRPGTAHGEIIYARNYRKWIEDR